MKPIININRDLEIQVENVQAALIMWGEWAKEMGYEDPDLEYWFAEAIDKVRSGNYNIIVAYDPDSGEPMGMVDYGIDYEPADRTIFAYVDKLYVRKLFRGGLLAKQLTEAVTEAAKIAGAIRAFISVKDDGPRGFYERIGFEPNDMQLMKYNLPMQECDESLGH